MKDSNQKSKSLSASPQDHRNPSKSLRPNSSYSEPNEGSKKSPNPERSASPKGNQTLNRSPSKSPHRITSSPSFRKNVQEAVNRHTINSPGTLGNVQEAVSNSSISQGDTITLPNSQKHVQEAVNNYSTQEHTVTSPSSSGQTQEEVNNPSTQDHDSLPTENQSASQLDSAIPPTQTPETVKGSDENNETEKRSPSPRKRNGPSQSPRYSPILCPVSPNNKGSRRSPIREHTPAIDHQNGVQSQSSASMSPIQSPIRKHTSPKDRRNCGQSPRSAPSFPFHLDGTPERDLKSSPSLESNVLGSGGDDKESNGKRKLDSIEETERVPKRQQRLSQSPPGSPLYLQEKSAMPDPGVTTPGACQSQDLKSSTVTNATSFPPSSGRFKQPDDDHAEGVSEQGQSQTDEVSKESQIREYSPATKEKELVEAHHRRLTDLATKYRGVYIVNQNSLTLTLKDPAMTNAFRDDLRSDTFLKRLDITMDDMWAWAEIDLKSIADAVVETNISQFILDGNGCVTENKQLLERACSDGRTVFGAGHTTPPRTGMLSGPLVGKLGLGTRFDPLIQLMAHPKLKKFHVKGMPEFLKEFDCDLPKELTHLDIL